MLPSEKPIGFLSKITYPVLIVAALAALFHIIPLWIAQLQTPPGAKFTGNLNISPDYMQYRVWSRRTQETGLLVDNTFTNEPNKPHLLVFYYYLIGKISASIDQAPEYVFRYAGSFLAFVFTIILFATIRHFMESKYQTWWCFMVILIGGGLGAHLLFFDNFKFVQNNHILNSIIIESLASRPRAIFEGYRGHYVFITLGDGHFIIIWLVTLISVISFYFTLRKFSPQRVMLTAALYAAMTLLHCYGGITLIMITMSVAFICWKKNLEIRATIITALVCIISVVICLWWQFALFRSSGLPIPQWRALSILVSTLLIAYPLGWLMIFLGLPDFYRNAGLKECFLLGWVLGCVVLTLSGPFYPYPDRGVYTLQIPLYLIAGTIYFSRHRRVTWTTALVIILVLGATPTWVLKNHWVRHKKYNPNTPYVWMSPEHCDIVDELRNRATEEDVLLVDKSAPDWATDDLWLAPYHLGKLYCGHFFLTPQYEKKRSEVTNFYETSESEEQVAFLERERIRFIYVNAQHDPVRFERVHDPQRFERIPGMSLLKSTSIGSLFEYSSGSRNVPK